MVRATEDEAAPPTGGEGCSQDSTTANRSPHPGVRVEEFRYDYEPFADICDIVGDVLFYGELLSPLETDMEFEVYFHAEGS